MTQVSGVKLADRIYTLEELTTLVNSQRTELKRLSNYATKISSNLNTATETSAATMAFNSNTTGKPSCTSGIVRNIGYGKSSLASSSNYWQYQVAYCMTGEVYNRYKNNTTSTTSWSAWYNNSYPVGSIYATTNSENPSTYLGGTWEAFGIGRALVGVDSSQTEFETVEKTGGEKTHKLTVSELPSHSHRQYVTANSGGSGIRNDYDSDTRGIAHDQGVNTMNSGGNTAHNNLQPYITVYMWKRTA